MNSASSMHSDGEDDDDDEEQESNASGGAGGSHNGGSGSGQTNGHDSLESTSEPVSYTHLTLPTTPYV